MGIEAYKVEIAYWVCLSTGQNKETAFGSGMRCKAEELFRQIAKKFTYYRLFFSRNSPFWSIRVHLG
jgi:hypothetical protein